MRFVEVCPGHAIDVDKILSVDLHRPNGILTLSVVFVGGLQRAYYTDHARFILACIGKGDMTPSGEPTEAPK